MGGEHALGCPPWIHHWNYIIYHNEKKIALQMAGGGLSKKSNIKMSKECPKLAVMYDVSYHNEKNSPADGWGWFK